MVFKRKIFVQATNSNEILNFILFLLTFLTDGNLVQHSEEYTNKIDELDARKLAK